ncbi:general transcription factor IIIAa isoform X2 [Electrophorus electricus]|uniref:general transcription factor IIIAa isoform X2 n=1 Tax=Electrophorus electricus TaxID=8005 RepID=UPI000F0A1BE5|nr:general transcription factor IIIAa isoform X2 [Electrophorus electricus]
MWELKNVSSGTYICSFPDCKASYNKQWKFDAHICKHTGERPFECDHEGCGKAFYSKSHLARHQITHTGERPFKCTEEGCTQGFTTNANLKKHISCKHQQGVKQYICVFEGCGKSFKKNNLLKVHECTHTLQLPHECSYEGCGKRFANPSKRKRHEKVHKGYPCTAEDCSFIGKNWTDLTKHRKEHKVKVQCDQCKKMFRDMWFLRQHQRVHSETRVVFCCPREGCTRSYTTAFNLQSHILSFHQEERTFTCTHPGCGKAFAMKQSLQRHCVVHDPERKKQKKPHPTRSLASRLSGYKLPRTHPSEISASGESSRSVTHQSRSGQVVRISEPTTEEKCFCISKPLNYVQCALSLGEPLVSDNAEITVSKPLKIQEHKADPSEHLELNPLVLETPAASKSEANHFGNTVVTQLQSNKSDNRFSQSEYISADCNSPLEPTESKTTVIQLLESLISDSPMIS